MRNPHVLTHSFWVFILPLCSAGPHSKAHIPIVLLAFPETSVILGKGLFFFFPLIPSLLGNVPVSQLSCDTAVMRPINVIAWRTSEKCIPSGASPTDSEFSGDGTQEAGLFSYSLSKSISHTLHLWPRPSGTCLTLNSENCLCLK